MSKIKQHNIVFNIHKIAKCNGYIYASIFHPFSSCYDHKLKSGGGAYCWRTPSSYLDKAKSVYRHLEAAP